MERLAPELEIRGVECDESMAKVSIVGVGMRNHSGVAAKMFQVLSSEGVNINLISTSEIRVSCLIPFKHTELAVRALHTAFGLDRPASA
jgi:aspartate kinase